VSPSAVGFVARYAIAYCASVFSIGFLLGIARTLWIAPRLGERSAELIEMPVMVAASFFVARALLSRAGLVEIRNAALAGLTALALLLCAELAVVVFLRGQTVADYVASRDPVSGSAYVLALLLFAAMPALTCYRRALR
jgi:hypothetical protein